MHIRKSADFLPALILAKTVASNMKKTIFLVICIFSFFKTNACDCETPKPIVEFISSEYVFEGKVISKVYAKDSLTFTVTFDITKHYKKVIIQKH